SYVEVHVNHFSALNGISRSACRARLTRRGSGSTDATGMLDPVSLEQLSEFPERNDPLLNLALAEEGGPSVLLSLVRCAVVGADALDVIAARVAAPGQVMAADEEGDRASRLELERHLVAHPSARGGVRDALLAHHKDDPFFV